MLAFSVFDKKAVSFNTPFFVQTKGVAMRSFADLVADKRTTVAQHPEDFALYEVGFFAEQNGKLCCRLNDGGDDLPPLFICEALDFVDAAESSQKTLK